MLELRDVCASYGDLQVLRHVSLTVREGEVVALFGPNGHGKSTLLKVVAGLHPATSGSIRFRGEEICGLPAHQIVARGLVYIPEERHLFPDMTVQENLRLGAYNSRARSRIRENLALVFEIFPRLAERRKQLCSTLSGGESRIVAIARGLMSAASLLLVDEPSIGLSPALKGAVFEAIGRIRREAGITVLIVEQEIHHALALCDRYYLLKKGQILFERPASEADVHEIERAYF
ncbi:MAG: ABC transporter ATP-binding protein [Chloroflexia bacterium]